MSFSIGTGAVWKNPSAVSIGSGGAWKAASGIWVGNGGAWKQVFTTVTVYSGSIVAGTGTVGSTTFVGYDSLSVTIGSRTPTTLSGLTVSTIATTTIGSTSSTIVRLSTGSNPGAALISNISVTQSGTTHSNSGPATYSYSAGIATWSWAGNLITATGSWTVSIT